MHFKLSAGLSALALCTATPAHANEKDWDRAGTIARNTLVVVALGLPAVKEDWNGVLQAGGSIGATMAVTYGLKETFPSLRPDGSDNKSFPSGHTSVSFAAAATLQNRHGWQVGLPAHIVAAFVGVSRVKADKHRWEDILVGAAVGEAAGLLITSRRSSNVQVFPWAERKGGGVMVAARF